jgi:hypothetical protein
MDRRDAPGRTPVKFEHVEIGHHNHRRDADQLRQAAAAAVGGRRSG